MGWNPKIAVIKALKAFGAHAFSVCVAALLLSLDEARIAAIIGDAFPPQIALVLVPLLMAGVRYLGNAAKHKPIVPLLLLGALLLPAFTYAQAPAPAPKPAAASMEADDSGAAVVDVSGWTLAILTKGEKREYVGGRVTVDFPLGGKLRAFARGDVTGTQDAQAFTLDDFTQPETFRSIEGFAGVRYPIGPGGLAVGALAGTSWSIEGEDGPLDPRMATALLVVRMPLPGQGYGYVGGGHRGPVGGAALVASITYPLGPTRLLVDYDYPLTTQDDGSLRPWVLKTGVAVPLKRWVLR